MNSNELACCAALPRRGRYPEARRGLVLISRILSVGLTAKCMNFCLGLLALLWLLPFIWMICAALLTSYPKMAILLPTRLPELVKFSEAFAFADWVQLYTNTAIFSGGVLAVQLVTITLAGYAFAYLHFPFKQTIFLLFIIQLLIVPAVLIVPNMITLRKIGLLDSLPGLMLPYCASAFGTFLMRQAFRGIPKSFIEAAVMDGASWIQVLRHVLVPMVKPSLLAFAIVSITAHWNEYIWPLMAINSLDNYVLTVGFASFAKGAEAGADWGLVAAGAIMIATPLILLFLLFQKRFISSFSFGEIK